MRWLIPCVLAGCAGNPAHETLHPALAGKKSPVDVYWPKDADSAAPLVIVAHGFARSRHRMSGWGTHLSGAGFVVAVPNLPSFAKHHDNADGILDLVDVMKQGYSTRVDAERVALVGFSAGGLASAVASSRRADIDLWIGLDPVDAGDMGARAVEDLSMPGLALFAEPHGCNAQGNGQAFVSSWGGPVGSGRIAGATHCDPEFPSNGSCALFCGKPDPERQARFVELATLTLLAGLSCDEAAMANLHGAGQTDLVEDWQVGDLLADLQTRCASDSPTTPAIAVD